MTETQEAAARRLEDARRRGDADDIAEALALQANALLQAGQTAAAESDLDEAAAIHASRGRAYDQARCLQMAGTLCRFLGRLEEASTRVFRALELVERKGSVAVSCHTELGEIALAQGRRADAAAEYGAALEAGEATGLVPSARASLLRKRAAVLTAGGQYDEAVRDLESARALLLEAGDRTSAIRTLTEQATALQHARRFAEAEPVIGDAKREAEATGDHAALADIHLLLATQALERGDPQTALASTKAARAEALAGNAPAPYIGAAIAIAELAEAAGDRLAAYASLATGWATVADLLPKELARAAFEPKLAGIRQRWGAAAFDEIKKTYEANRRSTRRP